MDNLTPWKEALKERTLYGCFVTYGLPDIAEVTALMGFDFLLLDNEHGVIEQSTLADMVRASQLRGVPAVVRCTMKEYDHIQKALDFGANTERKNVFYEIFTSHLRQCSSVLG